MPREVDFRTYVDWVIDQEGRNVDRSGLHVPYTDVDQQAIGFGHKIMPGENFGRGITEEQARSLLIDDLKGHAVRAARHVGQEKFDKLSRTDQIKLIEHEYTGGLSNFPKFTQAVLDGDAKVQLDEHERQVKTFDDQGAHSGYAPLKRRNDAWESLFFPEAKQIRHSAQADAVREASPENRKEEQKQEGVGPRLFASQEFQSLPSDRRAGWLAERDPRMAMLLEKDPARAQEMADRFAELGAAKDDTDILTSMMGGAEMGFGIAAQTISNGLKVIEDAGLIETRADDDLVEWANQRFLSGQDKIGTDWWDQIAAIAGGVPGGMLVPGLATGAMVMALPELGAGAAVTALASPVIGYGANGYLANRHLGTESAMKRAVIDGSLSLLGPLGQHLPRTARIAIETGANYAVSLQDDPTKRGIEALALGMLAGIPGKRPPIWAMERAGIRPDSFDGAADALEESRRAGALRQVVTQELDDQQLTLPLRQLGEEVKNTPPYAIAPQDASDLNMRRFQNRVQESMADTNEVTPKAFEDPPSLVYAPGPSHVRPRPWGAPEDLVEAATPVDPKYATAPSGSAAGPGHRGHWVRESRPEQRAGLFRPKPKTAGEVARPFLEAFGTTVQRGNVRPDSASRVRGWFLPRFREQKVDYRWNLQTLAHEMGHDISFQDPALGRLFQGADFDADLNRAATLIQQATGQPVRGPNGSVQVNTLLQNAGVLPAELRHIPELLSISYDRTNPAEGMAEFFRLYLTQDSFDFNGQPTTLARHVPNLHRRMEEWVGSLPRAQRKALRQFRDEAHAYVHEDAELSIRRLIGRDDNTEAALYGKATRFRQQAVDDLAGLENAWRQTRFEDEALTDSYMPAFRALRGTGEVMQGAIKWGAPELVADANTSGGRMVRWRGKPLREILVPAGRTNAERAEAGRYILAWQAEETLAQGRERLMSPEQIAAGNAIAQRRPELVQMRNELVEFANRIADFGEATGIFGREQRAEWRRSRFIHSFMRDIGDRVDAADGPNAMQGAAATRQLQGSDRNFRGDWIDMILDTHQRTIRLGMENAAKRQLVDHMLNDPRRGGGRFIEFLEPFQNSQGGRSISEATGNVARPQGGNYMTVWFDGKPRYYRVKDPGMVQALLSMRRPTSNWFMNLWGALRSFKQAAITATPGFGVAAFTKDVMNHSIMSKTGGPALTKMLGGLRSSLFEDDWYREFMMNGGGHSAQFGNLADTTRDLKRFAQRAGMDPRYMILTPRDVAKPLMRLSHALEVAGRVAEYKAARRQGRAAQHAVYLGREINTDFARRGQDQMMRALGNIIPFFSATIASHDRFFRLFASDDTGRQAAAMKAGMIALASVALYEYNRRNAPEYEREPDWSKNAFWHFYFPVRDENGNQLRTKDGQLMNEHWTMPKLYEFGLLGTMAERTASELHKSQDADWVDAGLDLGALSLGSLGVNVADRSFPFPMPVGLEQVVEQDRNRVLFTGNPIETLEMAAQSAWNRKRADTPEFLKKYGELAENWPVPDFAKSPARAEALLRSLVGEWVTIADQLTERRLNPDAPDVPLRERPVIAKFYRGTNDPQKYDRAESDFYDRFKKVDEIVNTMESLRREAITPEKVSSLRERMQRPESREAAALERPLSSTRSRVARINAQIESIKMLPASRMSPAAKTDAINKLITARRRIMSETLGKADEIEKRIEAR